MQSVAVLFGVLGPGFGGIFVVQHGETHLLDEPLDTLAQTFAGYSAAGADVPGFVLDVLQSESCIQMIYYKQHVVINF